MPPVWSGSCEYTEQAVADSRQGAALQLGCWARYQQLLIVKSYDVTKHFTGAWDWIDLAPDRDSGGRL